MAVDHIPGVGISSVFAELKLTLAPSDQDHAVRLQDLTSQKLALEAVIAQLESDVNSADQALQDALNAEISRATAKETELEGQISSKIEEIVGAAPEALNTLKELAAALGDDSNFAASLSNNLATLEAAIATEKARAEAAEAALAANVAAEEARASAAEAVNASAVAAEEARASAAEAANAAAVVAEEARASAAEAVNAAAVSSEQARAESAEAANTSALLAEQTRASATEAVNAAAIAAEQARASAAEAVNAGDIAAEVSRSTLKDAEITTSLSSEINRATSAESVLQSNINNESAARVAQDTILLSKIEENEEDINEAKTQLNVAIDTKLNRVNGTGTGVHTFDNVVVNGDEQACYLEFGNWRMKGSNDGSSLLFQYKNNDVWVTGVPFILKV